MFKNMKKVSAIFLALLLGLSTMTTVFAEGEIPEGKILTEEIIESGKNAITGQSEDVKVKAGETAVFTVSAQGPVRSYQWQVSKDGGKTWKKLDAKTNTLSIEAKAEYDGWLYRCAVSFKVFKVVYSEPVRLSIVKETPAQSFGSEGVRVEAPEGAFPEGTTMEAETPALEDVVAVLNNSGVKGSVLSALDLTFYNNGVELQPSEAVTVSFQAEVGLDPAKLALYHINAGAEELRTRGLKADELGFTYDAVTGMVTFEGTHFSTYSLVWTEGGVEMGATIVWGYMNGTEFVELEEGSTVTLDTTAATVSLANTIEGYTYRDAVYCTEGQTIDDGVSIGSTLLKTGNGWDVEVITHGEDEKPVVTRTAIADGSTIYAIYYVPGQPNPPGSSIPSVPSPTTEKTVTNNHDGTYTIQLDVTGATVTQDESHYVNVLVILDATHSMDGAKWTNAKAAMKALIETLCEGENAANAGKIDFALVTFGRAATVVQNWTKDNAGFKATCAGLNMVSTSGTNWEAGMRGGLYGVLNAYPQGETEEKHDPTYVIFLTDGDPNTYYWLSGDIGTRYNYNNRNYTVSSNDVGPADFYGNNYMRLGYGGNGGTSATRSKDEAKAIAAKTFLYGIYCGDSGNTPSGESFDRLVDVIEGAGQGGQDTIAANADTIESEFKKIAETALKSMGPSNISVDDGIPGLSSISANVAGEAGGYEYYKSTDGETFTEWPEAPGAVYSSENGVTWDLSEAGVVQAGTTYRIKFTVWPSQEAYDLLADLNNGVETLPLLKEDGTVDDARMVQLVVNIGNNRYTYTPGATEGAGRWNGTSGDPLTTEQLVAAIAAAEEAGTDVTYSVPTNTHLRTTYSFNDTTYTDVPADGLPSEDMLLEDTTISVEKLWHNYLDSRTDADIDGLQMVLSKDGAEYLEFDVSAPSWKAENIFISCGVIAGGVVKEKGHDYYVTEKAGDDIDKTAYWEVSSDVYHPMVIDGTLTMLIKVDTAAEADYTIDGKYYKKDNTAGNMTAVNERVSWLNLIKAQTDGINPDDFFEFTVTINEANDSDIYFSVFGGGVSYREDVEVSTNVTTYRDPSNNRLYYVAPSGEAFTLKVKPSWSTRFLNLYTGSTYTISESDMPECYQFLSATSVETLYSAPKVVAEGYPKTTTFTANSITGTVNQTNTDYTVTVTNKPLYFFVYHPSNNKIEKIQMDDARIVEGKFNIVKEINEGYLYGGYFKAYKGAKMTDAEIVAAADNYTADGTSSAGAYATKKTTGLWLADTGATKYTGNPASAWSKAYTESGLSMTPVAGTVYYLKEVPEEYFRPALYYVYDDRAEGKPILKLYFMLPTDDGYYQYVGGTSTGFDLATSKKLYSKFTVTNYDGTTTEYTAVKANSTLPRGYLAVWEMNDLLVANKTYTWKPFFVTKDNVKVTSITTRTITTGTLGYGSFDADDERTGSTAEAAN